MSRLNPADKSVSYKQGVKGLVAGNSKPLLTFIAELRRRKVVQVTLGYVAVSWLIMQFGSLALETFSAPLWAGQLMFVLLFLGLPVVIALSWIFDLTPEGILRTSPREIGGDAHDILSAVLVYALPDNTGGVKNTLAKLQAHCQRYGAHACERRENRLIARFDKGQEALHCAIYLQSIVSDSIPGRASLAIGEAGMHHRKLEGDAVSIAIKLEALSPPGGLSMSNAFFETFIDHPENPLLEQLQRIESTVNHHPVAVYLADNDLLMQPKVQVWQNQVSDAQHHAVGKWVTATGILMLAVIAYSMWRWLPSIELPGFEDPDPSIAVLPFRDLSQDQSKELLVAGLSEEVLTTIAGIEGFRVVSRQTSADYREQDRDITELGELLGVSHLLEGSVQGGSESIRINMRLRSTSDGSLNWAQNYNATTDNLVNIQQDIARKVAASLEVALSDEELSRIQRTLTINPEAYAIYLEAVGYLRQPASNETLTAAQTRLERVLESEPGFNDARAALCRTNLQWYLLNQDSRFFDLAEQQCAQALEANEQNVGLMMALGKLYNAKGDTDTATIYFQRGLALDSDDVELQSGMASVLRRKGQKDEAESMLKQAVNIEPGSWFLHSQLGTLYMSMGRNAEAVAQYDKASTLLPDNASVQGNIGSAYFFLGEFRKAALAYERSLDFDPTASAYSNIGTLWYFEGSFEKAKEYYKTAAEMTPRDYRVWANLADAESQIPGEKEQAREHYSRALDLATELLEIDPQNVEVLSLLAWCAVNIGLDSMAERTIAEAIGIAPENPNIIYIAATVYAALNQPEQSARAVEKVKAAGFPEQILLATPILKANSNIINN